MTTRAVRGVLFAGLLFLVVYVGAVSLPPMFEAAGYRRDKSPTNSVLYLGAIPVALNVNTGCN